MSRPKRFGRDSNLVSDGTIVFYVITVLKKKRVLKKHLRGKERFSTRRGSIQGEVQYTIHLLMYFNVIFAKNMSKNNFYPICDALSKKFNNSQTSLFMNKIYLLFSF